MAHKINASCVSRTSQHGALRSFSEEAIVDVDTLLSTEATNGRVALAARVALAQCAPDTPCPRYFSALEDALENEPPPFDTATYADIYADASTSWQWLAISLMTNAEREGDGAKRLWSL